jgi:hypothetical protein
LHDKIFIAFLNSVRTAQKGCGIIWEKMLLAHSHSPFLLTHSSLEMKWNGLQMEGGGGERRRGIVKYVGLGLCCEEEMFIHVILLPSHFPMISKH